MQKKYKKNPEEATLIMVDKELRRHILQNSFELEESYHTFNPNRFWFVFLAIFSVVRPGEEILVADPVYFPTRLFTETFLKDFKIKTNL